MKDQERNHVANFNIFCKIARNKLEFKNMCEQAIQDYIHDLYLEFREYNMGETAFEFLDYLYRDTSLEKEEVALKEEL